MKPSGASRAKETTMLPRTGLLMDRVRKRLPLYYSMAEEKEERALFQQSRKEQVAEVSELVSIAREANTVPELSAAVESHIAIDKHLDKWPLSEKEASEPRFGWVEQIRESTFVAVWARVYADEHGSSRVNAETHVRRLVENGYKSGVKLGIVQWGETSADLQTTIWLWERSVLGRWIELRPRCEWCGRLSEGR